MASVTHEPLTTNGDDWKTGPGNLRYQGLLRDQPKPASVKSADWRRACRLADGVTRSHATPAADIDGAARSHAPSSAAPTPPSKCAAATPTPAWPRTIVWPASWADDDDGDFDDAVEAKLALQPCDCDAAVSPRIGAIVAPMCTTLEATQDGDATPVVSPSACVPAQRSPFGRTPEPAALTRTQKRRERRTRVTAQRRDDCAAQPGAAALGGARSGSADATAEQPAPKISAATLIFGADGPVVTTPGQALLARLAPRIQQPATAAQAQWLDAATANPSYAPYVECELATAVPRAGLAMWYSLPASELAADQISSTVAVHLLPPTWTSEQLSVSKAVLKQRYDAMSRLPHGMLGPMPCQTRLVLRWGVPFWQLAGVAQQRARVAAGSTA